MSSRLWKKNWKVVKLKIGSVRKHRLRTTCMMVMSKSNYTVLKKCRKNIHWIKLEFLGCLKAGSYFSGLWVSGFGICDVGCFSDQSDLSPINEIGQFICLSLNIYTYFLWVPDYILFSALQIRVILIPLWVHISAVIYETESNETMTGKQPLILYPSHILMIHTPLSVIRKHFFKKILVIPKRMLENHRES